jgi:hypothetical protein
MNNLRIFTSLGAIVVAMALENFAAAAEWPEIALELLPSSLKGIKEVHRSRTFGLGWREPKWDDAGELSTGGFTVLFRTPQRRITLREPLDVVVEPRIKPTPYGGYPLGDFIAYGSDRSVWLIRVYMDDACITIVRLREAADDPELPKLYWEDWDEPQYKCKSRVLAEILHRESAGLEKKAKALWGRKSDK